MDRLRGRFEETLRELERLSQQEAAPPRPLPRTPPRPWATADREGVDAEPMAGKPGKAGETAPPAPPVAPPHASLRERDLRAALGSRAALRRAFLLREILGPPRALQDPRDDGRGGL